MDLELRGKIALVTGSTRSLGWSIARGLAEAGAHVAINGTKPEGVEQTVNRFEPYSGDGSRSVELFGIRLPDFLRNGENSTIGFEYKENLFALMRELT